MKDIQISQASSRLHRLAGLPVFYHPPHKTPLLLRFRAGSWRLLFTTFRRLSPQTQKHRCRSTLPNL